MAAGRNSVWSELPHHLLGLVFRHLSYADLIRSQAVCKSWLIALKSIDIKTHYSPMLLLAGNEISEFRPLLSLAEKKSYRLHLPQIRGCRILASAGGWLVTIDDAAELHLFNPFTLAKHALPSITTLSMIHDVERDSITGPITGYTYVDDEEELHSRDLEYMRLLFCHRAIIFHQSSSSEMLVFIICGNFRTLAFARPGEEEYWTEIDNMPPYTCFTDVVLHKGHYYGATSCGFCIAFDISSCSLPKVIYQGPENAKNMTLRHYLVESSDGDSLLHIWRHDTWSPERRQHDGVLPLEFGELKTQSFTVFFLDVIKSEMIKVKRLEQGTALFLGNNRSMLLRVTQDLPELKENCIYFTDGAIPYHSRWRVAFFDMTTGNVEPLYSSDNSIVSLRTSSPPVWFTLLCQ